MSRKLVTAVLTIAFLPFGALASAVSVSFFLGALGIVSPILVVWLAFYVASLVVNKLAEIFDKPSLKFEGFTAFTLDVIKRIAICFLVSIPLLPFSLITIGLAVAVIAPLSFVALAGYFSFEGAKGVISFFVGKENNSEGSTDNDIKYVNIPQHLIRPEGSNQPRSGVTMAPQSSDHYQSSFGRFFNNPVDSVTELYESIVTRPHQS